MFLITTLKGFHIFTKIFRLVLRILDTSSSKLNNYMDFLFINPLHHSHKHYLSYLKVFIVLLEGYMTNFKGK